jgi:hypothetical protein
MTRSYTLYISPTLSSFLSFLPQLCILVPDRPYSQYHMLQGLAHERILRVDW